MITRYVNSAAFGGTLTAITQTKRLPFAHSTQMMEAYIETTKLLANILPRVNERVALGIPGKPHRLARLGWFAILSQLDPNGER